MDFRQIRYLVAVADAGSFTAGAKRAFVAQPTLSAAIAALEKELGTKLFERQARGVALTAEGQRAVAHARNVLKAIREMRHDKPAMGARRIRLGLLPTLPPGLPAEVVTRLAFLNPEIECSCEDAPLAVLDRRLEAGKYDAVVGLLGPGEARGRRFQQLGADRLALAYPAAGAPKGQVTPQILHEQPLVVRTHCEWLQAASRILDRHRVRPRVVAQTESDARALDYVASGLGACLMPTSFQRPDVVFVTVRGVQLERRIGLIWRRGSPIEALRLGLP